VNGVRYEKLNTDNYRKPNRNAAQHCGRFFVPAIRLRLRHDSEATRGRSHQRSQNESEYKSNGDRQQSSRAIRHTSQTSGERRNLSGSNSVSGKKTIRYEAAKQAGEGEIVRSKDPIQKLSRERYSICHFPFNISRLIILKRIDPARFK
jgi:hypothetical protein